MITTIIYPSAMANRVHILSMAKAWAKQVTEVSLFCRKLTDVDFDTNVKVHPLAGERSIVSAWKIALALKRDPHEVWFAREPHLLLAILSFSFLLRIKKGLVIYEVHDMPRDYFDKVALYVLRLVPFILITVTRTLAQDISKVSGIPLGKILVLPDGVDSEKFDIDLSKSEARKNIGYTDAKKLIVYTGNPYPWKGVFVLLEAAKLLPDTSVYFVGGKMEEVEALRKAAGRAENVTIIPYVSHDKVPLYLKAADVLVVPNSATYRMSELYTSPLKLFEYMASLRPIVASALPSIKEILTDRENAYLVPADNAKELATGIQTALSDGGQEDIVNKAYTDAKMYTWDNRISVIMENINDKLV